MGHSSEKFKESIPEKVIINPWIGKKKVIAMTERIHKHRIFVGFVPKKYSSTDVYRKITDLITGTSFSNTAHDVRRIIPKKSSQKVRDYHNYYIELANYHKGQPIETKEIEELYGKLRNYCKV